MDTTGTADSHKEVNEPSAFCGLQGQSPAMQALFRTLQRVAPTDTAVLLEGECGTGKTAVARAIHDASTYADQPFIVLQCATESIADLIESEVFAAALNHQPPTVCITVFLDNVDALPSSGQDRLLALLDGNWPEQQTTPESAKLRLIAAAEQPLADAMTEGRLRKDLYYRLASFPIRIPALRERNGDVALLAQHFLQELNTNHGQTKPLTTAALDKLRGYGWPGNVRELKDQLQRAYILADDAIDAGHFLDLGAAPGSEQTLSFTIGTTLEDVERRLILATLAHFNGDKRRTADTLGVSLKTIYNRLHSYGLADSVANSQQAQGG
jgi:DNA-binding NtrC family response regulator